MQTRFSLFPLAGLCLLLSCACLSGVFGQEITQAQVEDIPNNDEGSHEFAGGARVTHIVNTRNSLTLRDFHICVGETRLEGGTLRRISAGDPRNAHYREAPGGTPPDWEYRGVQPGTSRTEQGVTRTQWYVTWVRKGAVGEPARRSLVFQFDYKGDQTLTPRAQQALFTNDGNNKADTGIVKREGAITLAEADRPGPSTVALLLAGSIGALAVWLIQVLWGRIRRGWRG